MLSRRINRNELQRLIALRYELMLRTSRHDDYIARNNFLVLTSDRSKTFTGGEKQDLINGMHLRAKPLILILDAR
jgi:hypothetical protein